MPISSNSWFGDSFCSLVDSGSLVGEGSSITITGGVVIVDRDTLETQREERERYEEWLDNWDRSTEETQRWREEQQKKKLEQEMIMQQEEDEAP